jgi:hypothetical protein
LTAKPNRNERPDGRVRSALGRGWEYVRCRLAALLPCRFSILVLAVVTLVFTVSDQGAETLRVLAEFTPKVAGVAATHQSGPSYPIRVALFLAATTAFALLLWFCSRQSLWFENDAGPPPADVRGLVKWAPRVLGALGFLGPGLGLLLAARSLHGSPAATLMITLAVALAGGAAAFLYVVSRVQKRQRITIDRYERRVGRFRYLDPVAKAVFWITFGVGVALFVVILWRPILFSQAIGAPSVLLLCACIWVVAGATLLFFARTRRFPILTLLVVCAFAWSRWTDNHVVERLPNTRHPPRIGMEDALLRRLAALDTDFGEVDHTIFIVAAEGGGIRAAYWTAAVLSAIQDGHPSFAAHCFAISGVSGGSLGAAVFTTLVQNGQTDYRDKSHRILSADFLSPTLARMFGADLPKQFLPFVPIPDRGRALELAWEFGWRDVNRGAFSKSFLGLLGDRRPILFLNGTWAETGRRIIFSPVKIDGAFENAVDGIDCVDGDLRISTAVHMSARFTYVSPAATILRDPPEPSMHVVDGGYFEDSGAATASNVLAAVDQLSVNSPHHELRRLHPHVLLIRYSEAPLPTPFLPDEAEKASDKAPDRKGSQQTENSEKFRPFSSELLSPVRAMVGARTARGQFAIEELKNRSGEGRYDEIVLGRDPTTPLPLGWLLSAAARNAIDAEFGEGRQPAVAIARMNGLFESQAPAVAYSDPLAKKAVTAQKGVEKDVGKLINQAIFASR